MKIIAIIHAAMLNCHPEISTSTAQSKDGICMPRDLCHRSLLCNRTAQVVSISGTRQTTPDQEPLIALLLKASEEDLFYKLPFAAAKHILHRPIRTQYTRGRTTSLITLGWHGSHTRAAVTEHTVWQQIISSWLCHQHPRASKCIHNPSWVLKAHNNK